jgi:2-polyprenyl-3-methyl-5-hydroxy-6-metoxy-1,4-benzoquinol methylase
MNTNLKCKLCGNETTLMHPALPGYMEPLVFKIYHCNYCNTSFSDPLTTSGNIYELIYKNKNKVPGYDRYWNYADKVKNHKNPLMFLTESEDTYWGIFDLIKQAGINENHEILEIGSGLGYLTYSLKQAGFNITGIDISNEAVSNASKKYGNYYKVLDVLKNSEDKKYDVIIATELIEHLKDINLFFDSIYKILNKNGKIIITTPNKSFFTKDWTWMTDLPPVHYWWLSEDSLAFLAKKNSMEVSFVDFSKYHSKHFRAISLDIEKQQQKWVNVFDRNGNLIAPAIKRTSFLYRVKLRILTNPVLGPFVRKIEQIRFPSKVRCMERGAVICAIFSKKNI